MTNRYNKFPRAVPANRPWLPYPETVPYALQLAQPIMISIDGGPPTPVNGGNGSGSQNVPLGPSGVVAGTYGDATHWPWFTVNTQGRITAAGEFPAPTGGGAVIPLSSGEDPGLWFISDGAGNAILIDWQP